VPVALDQIRTNFHSFHHPHNSQHHKYVVPQEVQELLALLQADINPSKIVRRTLTDLPAISRQLILSWSDRVLAS